MIINTYLKNESALFEQLENDSDLKNYFVSNRNELLIPLHQYLQLLIDDKNLTKLDVIHQSQLDRHYAYHIFSGVRANPSRNKVLALANAMNLNLDETQALLQHSRHCQLCPRSPADSIIISAIIQNLDVLQTNALLKKFKQIERLE